MCLVLNMSKEFDLVGRLHTFENSRVSYPFFLNEISCGLFGIADDFVENYLSLDELFLKNRSSTFFVRAGGDSMLPEIKPKDILIVDRSIEASNNSIVAIYLNGTPMCKQLILTGNRRILHSINTNYPNIEISNEDELVLFGVIVGIVRPIL